jgi:hypothetical protein
MRSSSPIDILWGSQMTPPLAPPNGIFTTFVERDVGRITDAALGRAARDGMLHAKSGEDFQVPVVHLHRNVQDDFARGVAQDFPQAFIQIELMGGQIKSGRLRFPRISFLLHRDTFHSNNLQK